MKRQCDGQLRSYAWPRQQSPARSRRLQLPMRLYGRRNAEKQRLRLQLKTEEGL